VAGAEHTRIATKAKTRHQEEDEVIVGGFAASGVPIVCETSPAGMLALLENNLPIRRLRPSTATTTRRRATAG